MWFHLLCMVVLCGIAAFSSYASALQPSPTFPPIFPRYTWAPPPPKPPRYSKTAAPGENTKIIESFHVKSDIRYRFATTQISSLVRNIAGVAQEISFDVILPKEAFIVSFFMEIEGKIYDGEVKEKSKAKKEYQAAVDKGQSAGHIRQAPRHSNIFEVSVNVAKGSAVNFTLTYQEILQRKLGLYDHEIHINPGQPVEDFLIEVYIQENKTINFVKTPALRTEALITNKVEADNQLTVVERLNSQTAYVSYRPPLAEQGKDGLFARFSVQYDVDHSAAGEVLVVDGYFVHFFAPDLPAMPKDIIFVLDVSGSMTGTKIEQLKTAMTTILNDLQTEDRLNIITFSSTVRKWKSGLMMAKGETMQEAKQFVQGMQALGLTDINFALLTAVRELKGRENTTRVPMIFFLTDGESTIGIQNAQEIAANVFRSNQGTASIFCLAFGEGANYDSLKTISAQNSGFARKIYEASDATLQVTSLYKEISAVVMKDISVEYLSSSADDYTLTKNNFPVVFNGSEIIICGVFAPQADVFELEIYGLQKSGEVSLVLEVDDVNNIILTDDNLLNPLFTTPRDYAGIVERMWAYLTIKQLLREKETHISDEKKVKELKEKALQMSIKYKFVTPLTSMVVTKPEESDTPVQSGLRDADDIRRTVPPRASIGKRYGHNPTHRPIRLGRTTLKPSTYPRSHSVRPTIQDSSIHRPIKLGCKKIDSSRYARPHSIRPTVQDSFIHRPISLGYKKLKPSTYPSSNSVPFTMQEIVLLSILDPSLSHYLPNFHSNSTVRGSRTTTTRTTPTTTRTTPTTTRTTPTTTRTTPTTTRTTPTTTRTTPTTTRTTPTTTRTTPTTTRTTPTTTRTTPTTTRTTPTTTTSVSSTINSVSAFNGSKILTLTYHDGDTTICLEPRKIRPGTYELFLIKGTSVQLQTDCSRNCRNVLLKEVSINHASGHRSLLRDGQFAPLKDNARSRGRPFSNEGLAISESGVTVTLSQMWKKNPWFISIDITVDPAGSSSGLIGDILSKANKFQSKKQPRRCKIFSPDVAIYLSKKRAHRFPLVA